MNGEFESIEGTTPRRPSLSSLTADHREMTNELIEGFSSRREILTWTQRLTIRTLGLFEESWYHRLGEQYRVHPSKPQRTLIAALLDEDTRRVSVSSAAARRFRERLAGAVVVPVFHRAFRRLRAAATEYVGEKKDDHDPSEQRFIAMRPSLDRLDEWQYRALTDCLDGFSDVGDIVQWRETLDLATNGEVPEGFIPRCIKERSTREVLLSDSEAAEFARESIAAKKLIPAFNRGSYTLVEYAGEEPDSMDEYKDEPGPWGAQ